MSTALKEWPLWEVFIRSQHGLAHKHVGSLHAPDAEMAINNARDVYTRRNEGVSIWVVPADAAKTSAAGSNRWLAAGAAPLFCLPGAGSGVTDFVDLMSALGPSVPIYGLQPRGIDVPHRIARRPAAPARGRRPAAGSCLRR